MMASAAARHPEADASSATLPKILGIFSAGSGPPITPVEAKETGRVLAADAGAGGLGPGGRARHAGLAGERIGVAAVDHQGAGLTPLEPGTAPFDRRRRGFGAGENASHFGSRRQDRQQ